MDRSYLDPLDHPNVVRAHSRVSDRSQSPNTVADSLPDQQATKPKALSKAQLRDLCKPVFPEQPAGSIVECMKLKSWSTITPRDQILDPLQHEQIHLKTPFPMHYKTNCKLALWVGDLTNLDCAAIVHTTNESFKGTTAYSDLKSCRSTAFNH